MFELFASFPSMCWLALLILFAVLEGATTTLVSLWFAVGALAALLMSLLTTNLWVQSFTFAIISLVMLVLMRPIAQKMLNPKGVVPTNADRLIGQVGIVTETIDELTASGQVKVASQMWSARTVDGSIIPSRHRVTVVSIEGVKLIVEPVTIEAGTASE
ncbi:MAG: NfeD family protein [Oscillospiraceae bacterium]|nr:NfeD family protein [Oscillospiraceae bacterium]